MPENTPSVNPAIHAVVTEAAVRAVGGCLRWNVAAYGKAWTGEDEDTRFLCHDVSDAVIAALHEAGYKVVRDAR